MGNDPSRVIDDLSPRPVTPNGLISPRTPNGSSVRRTRSFTSSSDVSENNPKLDKSIQRMDKTIRKRVRGGITYNMKIIIRGDKGTGKTSLFHRLKGEPIPTTHESTCQLQSATINWSYRSNSEENVKCEVWDVVDRGFIPTDASMNPFETNPPIMIPNAATTTNGPHLVATVDATTVDVYHETHGVIFLLDITKPHTLEYVRQHLDKVPSHIPTLVLGNFRDHGNQRKIFKEDIQTLLYPSIPNVRRPNELLYFECSLLNCYGLKSLHSYLGIPFLQLKTNSIKQQLRLLEMESTSLKQQVQDHIQEQRYVEYIEHIKATGSDIRTGRRMMNSKKVSGATQGNETDTPVLERSASSSSDVMVSGTGISKTEREAQDEMPELPISLPVPSVSKHKSVAIEDEEDLPERSTSAVIQNDVGLKIAYTPEEKQHPSEDGRAKRENVAEVPVAATVVKKSARVPQSPSIQASEGPTTMNLEDFQVRGALESFYSDEDDEDMHVGAVSNTREEEEDEDVVVAPMHPGEIKSVNKYHKQQFIDSDESDEENEEESKRQSSQGTISSSSTSIVNVTKPSAAIETSSSQRSPRRQHTVTKTSTDSTSTVLPSPPKPLRPLQTKTIESEMPSLPVPSILLSKTPTSPPRSPEHRNSPQRHMKKKKSPSSIIAENGIDESEVKCSEHEQDKHDIEEDTREFVEPTITNTKEICSSSSPKKGAASLSSSIVKGENQGDTEVQVTVTEDITKNEEFISEAEEQPYRALSLQEDNRNPKEEIEIIGDSTIGEDFFSDDEEEQDESRVGSSINENLKQRQQSEVAMKMPSVENDVIATPGTFEKPSTSVKREPEPETQHHDQESESLVENKQSQSSFSDDECVNESKHPISIVSSQASKTKNKRVDIILSDESEEEQSSSSVITPSLLKPVKTIGSQDALDAFLNDHSDSDDAQPLGPIRKQENDDEKEEVNDRFEAYDLKKTSRRGKAARRKEFKLPLEGVPLAPVPSSCDSTVVNQDVLAAIERAKQEAMNMMDDWTSTVITQEDTKKKKTKSKRDKTSKKSTRKRHQLVDSDQEK